MVIGFVTVPEGKPPDMTGGVVSAAAVVAHEPVADQALGDAQVASELETFTR